MKRDANGVVIWETDEEVETRVERILTECRAAEKIDAWEVDGETVAAILRAPDPETVARLVNEQAQACLMVHVETSNLNYTIASYDEDGTIRIDFQIPGPSMHFDLVGELAFDLEPGAMGPAEIPMIEARRDLFLKLALMCQAWVGEQQAERRRVT